MGKLITQNSIKKTTTQQQLAIWNVKKIETSCLWLVKVERARKCATLRKRRDCDCKTNAWSVLVVKRNVRTELKLSFSFHVWESSGQSCARVLVRKKEREKDETTTHVWFYLFFPNVYFLLLFFSNVVRDFERRLWWLERMNMLSVCCSPL